MKTLLQPIIILLLFIMVRSGDLALGAGVARDVLRAVFYGIVALLALIALILVLIV